jgi:hypothetical protein
VISAPENLQTGLAPNLINIEIQEPARSAIDNLASWIPPLDPGWATLVAGILALFAGWLVYRAAMSSLREERKNRQDEERRRKLNLYLKAEHMAYILSEVAQVGLYAAQLVFSVVIEGQENTTSFVPKENFLVARPKQLEELWDNLSDLPSDAIQEIRTITRSFDAADEYLKGVKQIPDNSESPLVEYYSSILDAARVLQSIMSDTELIKLHVVENPERDVILYGIPDDD